MDVYRVRVKFTPAPAGVAGYEHETTDWRTFVKALQEVNQHLTVGRQIEHLEMEYGEKKFEFHRPTETLAVYGGNHV